MHIPTPRINPDKRDEDRESDRFLCKKPYFYYTKVWKIV